jgi:hypothetical protein
MNAATDGNGYLMGWRLLVGHYCSKKTDVKPVRARPRPMPAVKRQLVQQETAALEKYNMIYLNPTSEWAHPVHVVPKPGAAQYRMTVDLRHGNSL